MESTSTLARRGRLAAGARQHRQGQHEGGDFLGRRVQGVAGQGQGCPRGAQVQLHLAREASPTPNAWRRGPPAPGPGGPWRPGGSSTGAPRSTLPPARRTRARISRTRCGLAVLGSVLLGARGVQLHPRAAVGEHFEHLDLGRLADAQKEVRAWLAGCQGGVVQTRQERRAPIAAVGQQQAPLGQACQQSGRPGSSSPSPWRFARWPRRQGRVRAQFHQACAHSSLAKAALKRRLAALESSPKHPRGVARARSACRPAPPGGARRRRPPGASAPLPRDTRPPP